MSDTDPEALLQIVEGELSLARSQRDSLSKDIAAASQQIEKLELMIGRFRSEKPELGDLSFRE